MPRGRDQITSTAELIAVAKAVQEPVFGNSEVAQKVDISEERTRSRLDSLVADGTLKSKRIGNTNVYWFDGY
jgi:predicted ArsR family transcriptional regulator